MSGKQVSGAGGSPVDPIAADPNADDSNATEPATTEPATRGPATTGPAFGWWPSPWPAAVVAAGKISRSGLQVDGSSFYWSESRPDDGGRQVVVRAEPGRPLAEASPTGVSVRSRVHEYGGGAATVSDGVLFYVDLDDQQWYRSDVAGSSAPVALTVPPPDGSVRRYADGRLTPTGRWLVSIEESIVDGATGHRLVAVSTAGPPNVLPLVEGRDFLTAPRPSPDGRWLGWVAWDHPSMPWDSSEVWVAGLDELTGVPQLRRPQRVAGGNGVSVGQLHWCRDGSLLFVDDRRGWWTPYRVAPDALATGGPADPLVEREAEFHAPDWVVGQSTMAELADGSLVSRMRGDGRDLVVRLRPPTAPGSQAGSVPPGLWSLEVVDQPCVSITGLAAASGSGRPGGPNPGPDRVGVLGSTGTEAQGVFEIPLATDGPVQRLSAAPVVAVAADDVATVTPFTTPASAGAVPGLFFAPVNRQVTVPDGSKPPLVVFCHGGPTSAAESGFDPVVQFFTSRGVAVAVVDYRGSSGYGRAYRRALDGLWGEADVDDCVAYAESLAVTGWVDGARMAIRGTSAGGLTALGALIRSRRFAGAAAWYGVTDLEALVADTHDFESRYVDSLVGPWPAAAARYRSRSPIHHADRVSGQVLLLQGADDPVVPAEQSEGFAEQLRRHQVPCRLVVFPGESHGFRQAGTIEACLTAEIDFYRSLFGGAALPDPSPAPE
jgi:acetyl esterase/lipase